MTNAAVFYTNGFTYRGIFYSARFCRYLMLACPRPTMYSVVINRFIERMKTVRPNLATRTFARRTYLGLRKLGLLVRVRGMVFAAGVIIKDYPKEITYSDLWDAYSGRIRIPRRFNRAVRDYFKKVIFGDQKAAFIDKYGLEEACILKKLIRKVMGRNPEFPFGG